jgi:predicted glycosyltransferase
VNAKPPGVCRIASIASGDSSRQFIALENLTHYHVSQGDVVAKLVLGANSPSLAVRRLELVFPSAKSGGCTKLRRNPLAGADICFLATSKSGLGHLRRTATIARRIREIVPDRRLHLVSMGLPCAEQVVLDTITVPGIEQVAARLALVLREASDAQLHRFRLAHGRPWDVVIVANPQDHWMPADGSLTARAITPVGWIYRPAGVRQQAGAKMPTVLVATGGGGTAETARKLYAEIDALLLRVRQRSAPPFEVVQAIGPRALAFGRLAGADRIIDPGARLNVHFRDADIVISTAGYNSVLELATTDTPTLLVPILRSIDDQAARARLWAPKVGCWHDTVAPDLSANWLAQEIARRRRRPPVDLGTSGEDRAAMAILNLG